MGILVNPFVLGAPPVLSGYSAAVEALSPLLRWKLDDTSGTSAAAAHGSAGTYVGTPTLAATGLINDGGTAVTTDGNTQEVTLPLSGLGTSASGSILFTFKATENNTVLFRDNTSAPSSGWFISLSTATGLSITRVGGTTRSHTSLAGASYLDGTRHMVLLTKDSTTATLYLDGVQVDQWANSANFFGLTTPLHLGRNGTSTGTTNFYPATYDDVAVFLTTLSSTDAAALWAAL